MVHIEAGSRPESTRSRLFVVVDHTIECCSLSMPRHVRGLGPCGQMRVTFYVFGNRWDRISQHQRQRKHHAVSWRLSYRFIVQFSTHCVEKTIFLKHLCVDPTTPRTIFSSSFPLALFSHHVGSPVMIFLLHMITMFVSSPALDPVDAYFSSLVRVFPSSFLSSSLPFRSQHIPQ